MKNKLLKVLLGTVAIAVVAGFGTLAYKYLQENDLPGVQLPVFAENFNQDILIAKAKKLARKDYHAPDDILSADLKSLDYDRHRDIRFVRENGPWYGKKLPFEVQFFHLGSIFQVSVPINEVINGKSRPIKYSSEFFDYGKNDKLDLGKEDDLGYAGFRLHNPLNTPAYYDELVSFLGASYFRALGKNQKYGLSARGLAIDTAVQTGEEFPIFREFWIERPKRGDESVRIYALLDSPSVAGAYTFIITPGENTTMETEAVLFPRKPINKLGIAPLTSMFLFGENTKNRFDDHRPEVHDSDGLLIWNGNNEFLWRPLDNSKYLRISSFMDKTPRGFGLMQRDRNPEHYLDFEAYYEQRPSLWVEPIDDWGEGTVQLVEIPSVQEIHDNIVAYWIPEEKIEPGKEYRYRYRLNWCDKLPVDSGLATVSATYTGIGGVSGMLENDKRKFVVDFQNVPAKDLKTAIEQKTIVPDVSVSEGKLLGVSLIYNPLTKGATVYMDFQPNNKTSELRISLKEGEKTISEIWSYQWLP